VGNDQFARSAYIEDAALGTALQLLKKVEQLRLGEFLLRAVGERF
jgi:hypothetical protein